MKSKSTFSREWLPGNIMVVILGVLAMTCVYLDGVDYPSSVKAGEIVTFTAHTRFEAAEDRNNPSRVVIAFLAPKSWNAASNTTATYTSNIDEGVQTMSLVPAGTVPKNRPGETWHSAIRSLYGFGANVLDDMEWIVLWSDKTYTVRNGDRLTADIKIAVKAGPYNLRFKPTFFLNYTDDGIGGSTDHYKVFHGDCFEVTDGKGDIIDFCQLQFNSAQPLMSTMNDYVTFSFQGDVEENDLIGAESIHFCATAFTSGGQTIVKCELDESTRMKKAFQFGNTYSITIWPASYFDVPEGEELVRIEYSFKNQDGSVEIKDKTGTPYRYTFYCE